MTLFTSIPLESVPPRGGQLFIFSIQSNNQPPLEVAAENVEVCLTASTLYDKIRKGYPKIRY